jgi:hypothetical protein
VACWLVKLGELGLRCGVEAWRRGGAHTRLVKLFFWVYSLVKPGVIPASPGKKRSQESL